MARNPEDPWISPPIGPGGVKNADLASAKSPQSRTGAEATGAK